MAYEGGYTSAVNSAQNRDLQQQEIQQMISALAFREWQQQQLQKNQDRDKQAKLDMLTGIQGQGGAPQLPPGMPPMPQQGQQQPQAQPPMPGQPSMPMMQAFGPQGGQMGGPPQPKPQPMSMPGWTPSSTASPALGGAPPMPQSMQAQQTGQIPEPPKMQPDILPPTLRTPQQLIEAMSKAGVPRERIAETLPDLLPYIDRQNRETIEQFKVDVEAKKAGLAAEREVREAAHQREIERHNRAAENTAERRADAMERNVTSLAAKRSGGGGTGGAGGGVPGGVGSQTVQDRNTGQKYVINTRSGKAWEFDDEEGKYKSISPNNVPKDVVKIGATGAMGARESVFTQRQLLAANQAAHDLENVSQLPITASTGMFGGRKQGAGLLDATKEVLANKMTSQEVQIYNTMATGFQRSLATIEAAGLMPSGSLTHQMDAVMLKEGDDNLTKLSKLAQIRQIVESGLETMQENPRVSDSEKEHAKGVLARIQKAVPYTQSDVLKLMASNNPSASLKSIMPKSSGSSDIMKRADAILEGK